MRLGLLAAASILLVGCGSNIKDGVKLLEKENYQEALVCFQEEIENGENLGEAFRGMGIAHFELEDYQAASEAFESALKNDAEKTATLYDLLGTCYAKLEQYETAISNYELALNMSDCTKEMKQEILYNEIALYEKMGDWDTVKERVSEYVAAYPDDTRIESTVKFLEAR